ncbi:hypothetical protein HYDPIDRAFT_104529 [Hydnomerulius pinastri MD-312]|nr:hypothetical protein HYDPIDRAFT_104529 [Hydnomerulius pinastri MD-312]
MFLDSLVNRPNTVLEQQKAFQSSHLPIYMRTPRARLYLGVYFTVYAAGLCSTAYGIYALAFTKPGKKE